MTQKGLICHKKTTLYCKKWITTKKYSYSSYYFYLSLSLSLSLLQYIYIYNDSNFFTEKKSHLLNSIEAYVIPQVKFILSIPETYVSHEITFFAIDILTRTPIQFQYGFSNLL